MDMSDEVWHAVWSDNVTLHWLKGWEADPTANTTCQDDKAMRDHVVECGEGPSFRMAAHHLSATLICISTNADAPMMIITSVDAQPRLYMAQVHETSFLNGRSLSTWATRSPV